MIPSCACGGCSSRLVLGLVILGPPQAWVAYVAGGGGAGPLAFLAT